MTTKTVSAAVPAAVKAEAAAVAAAHGMSMAAPLREKLTDALTPGYQAEFDPEEAERAGAFEEDALSEADAMGSTDDLAESGTVPVFIEDGEGLEIPANVTTANARTLFGKKPGESVKEAVARLENERQGE